MKCTKTHLEDYIEGLYKYMDILDPLHLNKNVVSQRLSIILIHAPMNSMHASNSIVIDSRLNDKKQWQEFGHELCHTLWHGANQRVMNKSFLSYQEWKADSFSMHFCVPTFMLDKIDFPVNKFEAIGLIANDFGVEFDFAEKRLEKWLLQKESQNVYSRSIGF